MFYVDIFERTNAQESERLGFPFEEEILAEAMAKHGWEDVSILGYKVFHDGGSGTFRQTAWVIDHFCEHSSLMQLNITALIAENIPDYEFDRSVFYYDKIIQDANPLSFANVMYQIQDSYVCSYEYSRPDDYTYERLGKEIAGKNSECGEGIPEWATWYVDYIQIGRDYAGEYYFDDEYYICTDDCNICEDECNWDVFEQYLEEKRAQAGGTYKSATDKLLEFLEVSA